MVITETERLVIRCFSVDDAEGFFALNNDPVVMRYTGDKPFATMEEAKSFLRDTANTLSMVLAVGRSI